MFTFPTFEQVRQIIELAKSEDMGGDDVTGRLLIDENAIGVATLMQRDVGIACGLPIVEMICRVYDERLRVELIPGFHMNVIEGRHSDAQSTPLLRLRGPMRSLLSAERIVLNFLQRMSGVAPLTQRFVRRTDGTAAGIFDTRKTIPGHRLLDKYAVRRGGGFNNRVGLYDGLFVKDNHIAGRPPRELAGYLQPIVNKSRAEAPQRFIEVEVDTLEQLREVLKVDGIDVILLDNMDCPRMQEAVQLRNKSTRSKKVELEASGGVTLETVRSIALAGVERISVGAITHSAPGMDIGLDIE